MLTRLRFISAAVLTAALLAALFLGAFAALPGGAPAALAQGGELFLTILHTNDEHSAMIPHSPAVDFHPALPNPTVGGFARLASVVKQIRDQKASAGEPVLLLSGGDYISGSPFSWLIPRGLAPELTVMQQIGYDAVIIGNHEYDYGPDNLARYLKAAGHPHAGSRTAVLASNTVAPANHPLAALFEKTRLVTLDNGLTVGLFGLIGHDAVTVAGGNPGQVTFLDRHEIARACVAELQKQGAAVIIAITHAGVDEDRALAAAVPGIHVIVGGHCHTALHEPVFAGETVIVQAGEKLKFLGCLELAYSPATGRVRVRNAETGQPYLTPLDYRVPLDQETAAMVDSFTAKLNALIADRTGGRFAGIADTVVLSEFPLPDSPPLQETPFANFVTDAMRLVAWRKTGERVDFAIQANGQIRGSLQPGSMDHSRGKVSFYDLADLAGLGLGPDGHAGYPIVIVYLTGEEVRRVLEVAALLAELLGNSYYLQFSGLRYDYNPDNAILFTVPFAGIPLPSTRAVVRAERWAGEGPQPPGAIGSGSGGGGYVPLKRGDAQLYRVVTDAYIVSFLPMVGDMLPMLNIVLKDRHGNPIPVDKLDDQIVRVNGEELKVWQTVVEYAASQPSGPRGLPVMDGAYASTAGRINPVRTIPYTAYLLAALAVIIAGFITLARRLKRRRRKRQARRAPA